jgi:hypothetical protein
VRETPAVDRVDTAVSARSTDTTVADGATGRAPAFRAG